MSRSLEELRDLNPPADFLAWVGDQEPQDWWSSCPYGDRMLWICARLAGPAWSEGRRRLVRCGCACVQIGTQTTTSPYSAYWHHARSFYEAIYSAGEWANGQSFPSLVVAAAERAAVVSEESVDGFAAMLAAACHAGMIGDGNPYQAAEHAISLVQEVANAIGYTGDRDEAIRQCADVVRKHYPTCPLLEQGGKVG